VTAIRKQIVQTTRPWEKAPTFLKAQEKAEKAIAQKTRKAQRKRVMRTKA
jgi:hypothetical protein